MTTASSQPYETLLRFWADRNPHRRHLYAGNLVSKLAASTTQATGAQSPWTREEVLRVVEGVGLVGLPHGAGPDAGAHHNRESRFVRRSTW